MSERKQSGPLPSVPHSRSHETFGTVTRLLSSDGSKLSTHAVVTLGSPPANREIVQLHIAKALQSLADLRAGLSHGGRLAVEVDLGHLETTLLILREMHR